MIELALSKFPDTESRLSFYESCNLQSRSLFTAHETSRILLNTRDRTNARPKIHISFPSHASILPRLYIHILRHSKLAVHLGMSLTSKIAENRSYVRLPLIGEVEPANVKSRSRTRSERQAFLALPEAFILVSHRCSFSHVRHSRRGS